VLHLAAPLVSTTLTSHLTAHASAQLVTSPFTTAFLTPPISLPGALPGTDVSVKPNGKLPGTPQLNTLVGGLVTWVLLACVTAVLLGAAAWGIGSRSGHYGATQQGRMMVLGGAVGAMVAGAAAALVNFGFGLGSSVQ
jgi:hypothetical protein